MAEIGDGEMAHTNAAQAVVAVEEFSDGPDDGGTGGSVEFELPGGRQAKVSVWISPADGALLIDAAHDGDIDIRFSQNKLADG